MTQQAQASSADGAPLLEIRGLCTHFDTSDGVARAVDGVDLQLRRGRTLGLVGESGCGKSLTALSVLGLVEAPGRVVAGKILFEAEGSEPRERMDLLQLSPRQLRRVRGRRIAMVFQEPMTSLNPVYTVGEQIMEVLRLHLGLDHGAALQRAVELLERVGVPAAAERVGQYPHQLSGGMRQRVMIAMALACEPELLIADEPTTALDVTIQAQILDLLRRLQRQTQMAILLISHDLGVVAQVADEVAVMYAGRVVEWASTRSLFARPLHPYTVGLFECLPSLHERRQRLASIPGTVPSSTDWPSGCRFRSRCPLASERCSEQEPPWQSPVAGHALACHHVEQVVAAAEAGRTLFSEGP